jgi:hypothetical protein
MNESSLLGGETPTTRLIKIDAMRCGEISFVGCVNSADVSSFWLSDFGIVKSYR